MIINYVVSFERLLRVKCILERKEKDASESKLVNCTKVGNYKAKEKVVFGQYR
ncbi:hypothetical protein [Borrelia miyamotoi]|uniref:hypothetical protein n=1 Tax=Borrelia miyamotoi TaxID=47466 RepID=UPI001E583901|nr:hypothetical protein [Borrelia miyamotoi]